MTRIGDESGYTKKIDAPGESGEKKGAKSPPSLSGDTDDSVVKKVAPDLESLEGALEAGKVLVEKLPENPEKALEAVGNLEEEKVKKLLEE